MPASDDEFSVARRSEERSNTQIIAQPSPYTLPLSSPPPPSNNNNDIINNKENSTGSGNSANNALRTNEVLLGTVSATHGVPNYNDHEEPMRDVATNILRLTGPMVVSSALGFSVQTITNSFVGRRLGADTFAHYTLGVSVANLFGFSIGFGLNGAIDTFVSQAFGRDKQESKDIGVTVQRAALLSAMCSVPLSLVFWFGGPIFSLLFGSDLGHGALGFTRHAVPNLIIGFGMNILGKTFQAINLPHLALYATACSSTASLILNYLFTESMASAVYVLTTANMIQLLVLILILLKHPDVTFWQHCEWPSPDAFSPEGVRQFLTVGIPSLIAVCAEWWAFEVLDVVAASISVHTVAAVNLVLTIGMLYFSVSYATCVSSSVRVGNALGENRPKLALQYMRVGLSINQIVNFTNATGLILFRRPIVRVFTSDVELEDTWSAMILVVALYICGDSTQYFFQSLFRSTGQQRPAAKIVLISLWAVGIPMSFLLGKYFELGPGGVVGGLVCGFVIEIPLMWLRATSWDWAELGANASKRLDETVRNDGDDGSNSNNNNNNNSRTNNTSNMMNHSRSRSNRDVEEGRGGGGDEDEDEEEHGTAGDTGLGRQIIDPKRIATAVGTAAADMRSTVLEKLSEAAYSLNLKRQTTGIGNTTVSSSASTLSTAGGNNNKAVSAPPKRNVFENEEDEESMGLMFSKKRKSNIISNNNTLHSSGDEQHAINVSPSATVGVATSATANSLREQRHGDDGHTHAGADEEVDGFGPITRPISVMGGVSVKGGKRD